MTDDGLSLDWRALTSKSELTALEQFQCAEPWPKSPTGRKLPKHPRPWEWDAQRHVRCLRKIVRPGDRVIVGVDTSVDPEIVAAVTHLSFRQRDTDLVVVVEVGGVAMGYRGSDPPYVGDQIMAVAESEGRVAMAELGCTTLTLGGYIHVENNASMRMAGRDEWEPTEAPAVDGYVRWRRTVVGSAGA